MCSCKSTRQIGFICFLPVYLQEDYGGNLHATKDPVTLSPFPPCTTTSTSATGMQTEARAEGKLKLSCFARKHVTPEATYMQ